MTFSFIPPGSFLMGSPQGEPGRREEEVRHRVTLTRPFSLPTCPVTWARWRLATGRNSLRLQGEDDHPVAEVSWDDCQKFCRGLRRRTGLRFRLDQAGRPGLRPFRAAAAGRPL
jgi:formylglycine-generating enzyme required for sulfatase activity